MAIISLVGEAMIAFDSGDYKKVDFIINELREYTSIGYDVVSKFGAGTAHYFLGQIFTKLSKFDEAIKHLKESRNLGVPVDLFHYKYDFELAPLVGIPEFDALTSPIWPEVKD